MNNSSLAQWPLITELQGCKSILLAGAGGGFDIYSGIPLYIALKQLGLNVHLANLSFASLPRDPELWVAKACARINADTPHSNNYFPEYLLCRWFREKRKEEVEIYAFPQTGVKPLTEAYSELKNRLDLDAVVLVDGGTDSLMRGDEFGLGTPSEDIASIAAVAGSGIEKQLLACIGFGIDHYHGVCHAQFLEAVAALSSRGANLGVSSVLPGTLEGDAFIEAVDFANEKTPRRESIVANSIASAIEGEYGDIHRTDRTAGSSLWINPLMPIYWAFKLDAIVERNLYLNLLSETDTMYEVLKKITVFRGSIGEKPWESIPV